MHRFGKQQFSIITFLSLLLLLGVTLVSYFLYLETRRELQRDLSNTLYNNIAIFNAVSEIESQHQTTADHVVDETLAALISANQYMGHMDTNPIEVVLAKKEEQFIHYLFQSKHPGKSLFDTRSKGTKEPMIEVIESAINGKEITVSVTDLDGKEVTAIISPLPIPNLAIVVKTHKERAYGSLRNIIITIYLGAISLIILGSALFYRLTKNWLNNMQHNQSLLQSVLDNSPALIYLKDTRGQLLVRNRRHTISTFHETHTKQTSLDSNELAALSQGSINTAEITMRDDQDTEEKTFRKFTFPVFDKQARISGVGAIMLDITEAKTANLLAQQSATRFQAIFNNELIGIIVADLRTGEVIDINQTARKQLPQFDRTEHTLCDIGAMLNLQDHRLSEMIKNLEQSTKRVYQVRDHDIHLEVNTIRFRWLNSAYLMLTILDVSERVHNQQHITRNQKLLTEAQRVASVGHWEWDILTNELSWSKELFRIFEADPQEVTPSFTTFLEHIPPTDHVAVNQAITDALNGEKKYFVEHRIITGQGNEKFIQERGFVYRDDSGRPIRMIGTAQDITDRVRQQSELKKLISAIEHNPIGIVICDAQGKVEYINPQFTALTGFTGSDILNKGIAQFLAGEKNHMAVEITDALDQGKHWSKEITYEHHTLQPKVLLIKANPIEYNNIGFSNILITLQDITEQKRTEQQVWYQANYDNVTGLANRMRLHDQLKNLVAVSLREYRTFPFFYIDLDDFKSVNDNHGHHIGDRVLVECAERLKACFKRQSDLVARVGGDEFCALMASESDKENLEHIAQNVATALSAPIIIDDQKFQIGCSIGISLFPENGETCDELMRSADQAMYAAKSAGRNTYRFVPSNNKYKYQRKA